jgi:hypothetical protein
MRVMLGIAIALPLAALFCLAYLSLLGLEAWRDGFHSLKAPSRVLLQRETWTRPRRLAA